MPNFITKDKPPESELGTLPNTAFVKSMWAGQDVYVLPTNTPDPTIKQFLAALNVRENNASFYYAYEMLIDIKEMPEIGFESTDYYCKNGVDGWYIIANVDFYDFLDTKWSINHDFWIVNQDGFSSF